MARKNPAVKQEESAEHLRAEAEEIQERVRAKAYELSRALGGTGNDFHDWLRAEAETVLRPTFELIETDEGWKAEFAVPGLEASDLEIRLGGGSLVVKGERRRERRKKDERIVVTEYRATSLFREVAIPLEVDTEKVKASLEDGILCVQLPRRRSKSAAASATPTDGAVKAVSKPLGKTPAGRKKAAPKKGSRRD